MEYILIIFAIIIISTLLLSNQQKKTFSDGMRRVNENNKYGYFDKRGKQIIAYLYEEACDFKEGVAPVKKDEKWGVINKEGNEIIPCVYDEIGIFYHTNFYVLGNNELIFLDEKGKKSESSICIKGVKSYFDVGLIAVKQKNKWGLYDKVGNEVCSTIYNQLISYSEGLISIRRNKKFGFINEHGVEVVPAIYDDCSCEFNEGLLVVQKNEKYGIINKEGKEVIPFIYDLALDCSEGLISVKIDNKWGVVDKAGNEVIPFIYDCILGYSSGLAGVMKADKWGFIDKEGNEVIPCVYDRIMLDGFNEGLAGVMKDGKWGFINNEGNEVISFIYDRVLDFNNGKAQVQKGDNWLTINRKGKICNNIGLVSESCYCKNGKFIDSNAPKWVIDKKLWETIYFHHHFWIYIVPILCVISTIILSFPMEVIKKINYSIYVDMNKTFLRTGAYFILFQFVVGVIIVFMYSLKNFVLASMIKVDKDDLIICLEDYTEVARPFRIKYIPAPYFLKLQEYEILVETKKFIIIRYKDGDEYKKLKILTKYFQNSDSLISSLKEKAINGNEIKVNKKYISMPIRLIILMLALELIVGSVFAGILFIDVKQTKEKLASYQFYASDKNEITIPYTDNIMHVEYSREKEIFEPIEEESIEGSIKYSIENIWGTNEETLRKNLQRPYKAERKDNIKYTYDVNGIKTYDIELYYSKNDNPEEIANDIIEVMRNMEELHKNKIIECINSIVSANENTSEKKIDFSSGGNITFMLMKYPVNPSGEIILERSYIMVKCEL